MATFTWYGYMGTTPDWVDIDTDTICFSGDATDISVPVTVDTYQDGIHVGTDDPGADQCGANHMRNVKYITDSQFDSGGGTETLNDTNLSDTECTLKIYFTDAASVATSSARFYAFDGTTTTTEAVGVEAYAFEQGVTETEWTEINDDSDTVGGDNAGERLDLSDQSAATEHDFFIAVSVLPESVGDKTDFDLGIALTYS
jgi:hypothetical protein